MLIMLFVYIALCLMTFMATYDVYYLKQLGHYSQSHGRQLQVMRKRSGCGSKSCMLAGLVVPGSSSLPSTLRPSLPFALPFDLPSWPFCLAAFAFHICLNLLCLPSG